MEININQKRELFTPNTMQVRESQEGKPLTIEGCAIVFNKETTLYEDEYYRVREVILPSCVTPDFLAKQDVKLNLLHKRSKTIGRNNQGKGTLQMEIREDGLYFSIELPDCDLGRQCYELVKNGTYTGCSFEFMPGDYKRDVTAFPNGGEDVLITHEAFRELSALTVAMDPAYNETEVSAREQHAAELREKCKKEDEKPEDENKPADEPKDGEGGNPPADDQKDADEAKKQAECKKREQQRIQNEITLILMEEDNQ